MRCFNIEDSHIAELAQQQTDPELQELAQDMAQMTDVAMDMVMTGLVKATTPADFKEFTHEEILQYYGDLVKQIESFTKRVGVGLGKGIGHGSYLICRSCGAVSSQRIHGT